MTRHVTPLVAKGMAPVDWFGNTGVPGTKSQGKGQVQPGRKAAGQIWQSKRKTLSNCETSVVEIQGTTLFF